MNSFTFEASFHSYFTENGMEEFKCENYKELGLQLGLTIREYFMLLESD